MPSGRRRTVRVRRLLVVFVLALGLAGNAAAGIAVDAVTPHSVRPGETLKIRVSAGLRLWQKIPFYLVPSTRALRPRPCQVQGHRGFCEPKVDGPPAGGGYVRIATVSFRRQRVHLLVVRVPALAPGRYEVAFYCAVCYRGPGGSLISNPRQAFHIGR